MGDTVELTDANFEKTTESGVTLIDFWAEWCGPCRAITPIINELASDYEGSVTIAKVNIDNEVNLAQKFGVSSIPTLLILKDGEESKRFVGVTPKAELSKAIDAANGG